MRSTRSARCGYHGWRYGLDGRLDSAAGSEGFGGIDISRMRLKSVRVAEAAGLVWVCLDEDTPDLSEHWQGIHEELLPYALSEMRPIQETVFTIPVNWKSMLENAFDYYHVHQVHRFTIHAHVNDQPELALYGDHIRQNLHIAPYRWRRWLDSRCSRGVRIRPSSDLACTSTRSFRTPSSTCCRITSP